MKQRSRRWFSKLYGIEEPQYRLPFVDFDLERDVPLYIDPYAIARDPSELARHCTNAIIDFFEALLDAIRNEDDVAIRNLLRDKFNEPDQIHLGVSKKARGGRGIGGVQEADIVNALRSSTAAKTGLLESLQELELHVPHIGPDKISDLVANVILKYLARFTEDICEHYGVATTPCAVDGYWDVEAREWSSGFFNLPSQGAHSYILVPKRFVRRQQDLMNHRDFYEKYILTTLQREHLKADDSLVKTLKSGKRQVTKKSLKGEAQYGLSKEFISEFIAQHPETIREYRRDLSNAYNPADPAQYSEKTDEDDPEILGLMEELPKIPTGREHASRYQQVVSRLIEFVFDDALENFEVEYRMDGGIGRIDIVADNMATGGFFHEVRRELNAALVPMECKNYSAKLGNDEFNQLASRMGSTTSRIGLLFCREVADKKTAGEHVTNRWTRHGLVILLLDDSKLIELVRLRLSRNFKAISARLRLWSRDAKLGNYR